MQPEYLAVGRVLRPHGVRGELLLESYTDFPEHLRQVKTVFVGEPPEPHPLAAAKEHSGQLIVRLGDCANRECAEAYRGQLVQVRTSDAAPLPPGRFYQHQLVGLQAITEAGEGLGEVAEVLETGANDVYVVKGPAGDILLPAIKSVVLSIDLAAGQMVVRLLKGML
jgi:16S rRNA processing protein RimM